MSIAITLLAIAAGSIFNNVRISDSASAFNKRIDDTNNRIADTKELLRAEIRANTAEIHSRFSAIDTKLDSMLKLLADVDSGVTRLEERPR